MASHVSDSSESGNSERKGKKPIYQSSSDGDEDKSETSENSSESHEIQSEGVADNSRKNRSKSSESQSEGIADDVSENNSKSSESRSKGVEENSNSTVNKPESSEGQSEVVESHSEAPENQSETSDHDNDDEESHASLPKRSKKKNTSVKSKKKHSSSDEDAGNEKVDEDTQSGSDNAKDDDGKAGGASEELIKNLRRLLKISGIKHIVRRSELEQYPDDRSRIKYLKGLFRKAGYRGRLSESGCKKFRAHADQQKELAELDPSQILSYEGRSLRSKQGAAQPRKRRRVNCSSDSESSGCAEDPLKRLKDFVSTD